MVHCWVVFGKATIAKPGGDKIGRRRLDTHFLGFKNLGAHFGRVEDRDVYEIQADKLVGYLYAIRRGVYYGYC